MNMFDITEVYKGSMVSGELSTDEAHENAEHLPAEPHTAEEILQHAREEAAELLEKARAEADQIIADAQHRMEAEAENQVALRVNAAFHKLGEDVYTARGAITEIVGQSVEMMLGAIGTDKAFSMAVEQATRQYLGANKLRIHAHPDNANRLRLYAISNGKDAKLSRYEIIDDLSLEAGRCLLDTGEKRIEVSLDVQIQAIRNSLEQSMKHVPAASAS